MRLLKSMLVVSLLAASLLVGGPASAATVTVTLRVAPEGFVVPSHWAVGNPAVWIVDPASDKSFNGADGVAGCSVTLTNDADGVVNGRQVLNRATATQCIAGWAEDDGFVTAVDGLAQIGWPASWWLIQVDGISSNFGIDDMQLTTGRSLEFVYLFGP